MTGLLGEGGRGTQFTCFTGTTVQILTLRAAVQGALAFRLPEDLLVLASVGEEEVLSLLALLVQSTNTDT